MEGSRPKRIPMAMEKSTENIICLLYTSRPIINNFKNNPDYEPDMFLRSSEAAAIMNMETALIVVDVNRPSYTEGPELLNRTKTVVILDHHRQSSESIESPVLSYIEPYALSLIHISIGNALEVKEAVDTLRGQGPADFTELVLSSGANILAEAGLTADKTEGRRKMETVIADGSALKKLKQMVRAQGGDADQIEHPELLPKADFVTPVFSKERGYIPVSYTHL